VFHNRARRAAEALKISTVTLWRKMKQFFQREKTFRFETSRADELVQSKLYCAVNLDTDVGPALAIGSVDEPHSHRRRR
jgi:hypothetical protein